MIKDDDLLDPTPEEIRYFRKQQNQYAKLSVTVRETAEKPYVALAPGERLDQKQEVSKEEFTSECRRILGFYVPAVEKGRLRTYHKNFITRNVSRPASERFMILTKLRKYDLSDLPGFRARFNREPEQLTEAKLKQIEDLSKED